MVTSENIRHKFVFLCIMFLCISSIVFCAVVPNGHGGSFRMAFRKPKSPFFAVMISDSSDDPSRMISSLHIDEENNLQQLVAFVFFHTNVSSLYTLKLQCAPMTMVSPVSGGYSIPYVVRVFDASDDTLVRDFDVSVSGSPSTVLLALFKDGTLEESLEVVRIAVQLDSVGFAAAAGSYQATLMFEVEAS